MEPISFQAISINKPETEPPREGYVYIPEIAETIPSKNSRFPFGPSVMPFHSWPERERLGDLMKGWLEKQPERYRFRDQIDHVIRHMHEHVEVGHIMALAAGLESLSELDRTSPYTGEHIEILVKAAYTAAKDAGFTVSPERLSGVLGLLRKENLGKRLQSVQQATSSWMPPHNAKSFNKTIQKIRNHAAHGTGGAISTLQQLSQTIQAFAGLCVLWDLTSSGLNVGLAKKRINSLSVAAHALIEGFPAS